MRTLRVCGVGLLALSLAAGCTEDRNPRPGAARSSDAGAKGTRVGIRVPLPPDWEARQGADGELRVGPTGKAPVLRIARRPVGDADAPELETLTQLLPGEAQAKVERVRDTDQARILTYPVGSTSPERYGLIGARRMGEDWLLCAATRALDTTELEAAVEACAGLTLAAG